MHTYIKYCLLKATCLSFVTLIGVGIGEAREHTQSELEQAQKNITAFLTKLYKRRNDTAKEFVQEARRDLETTLQQILNAKISHFKNSIEQSDLSFSVAMKKIETLERSAKKNLKTYPKEFASKSVREVKDMFKKFQIPERMFTELLWIEVQILTTANPKQKALIKKAKKEWADKVSAKYKNAAKGLIEQLSKSALEGFKADLESFEDNALAGLTPSDEDEKYTFILSGLWLMVSFFMQRLFERIFDNRGYALLTVCAVGFLLAFLTANYFLLGGSVTGGLMGGAASGQSS